MSPLAEQWRAAADVLRRHAAELDRKAEEAEQAGNTIQPDVVQLLHELDGHLGLAIHRGEAQTKRWMDEADDYRTRIRRTLKQLGE